MDNIISIMKREKKVNQNDRKKMVKNLKNFSEEKNEKSQYLSILFRFRMIKNFFKKWFQKN